MGANGRVCWRKVCFPELSRRSILFCHPSSFVEEDGGRIQPLEMLTTIVLNEQHYKIRSWSPVMLQSIQMAKRTGAQGVGVGGWRGTFSEKASLCSMPIKRTFESFEGEDIKSSLQRPLVCLHGWHSPTRPSALGFLDFLDSSVITQQALRHTTVNMVRSQLHVRRLRPNLVGSEPTASLCQREPPPHRGGGKGIWYGFLFLLLSLHTLEPKDTEGIKRQKPGEMAKRMRLPLARGEKNFHWFSPFLFAIGCFDSPNGFRRLDVLIYLKCFSPQKDPRKIYEHSGWVGGWRHCVF